MFTVSTAAATTDLTTLARVKTILGITDTSEDDYLNIVIPQVSAFVCDYLDVATAEDGTKTLGRETLVETFMLREKRPLLQTARAPIVSITSVVEDDSATALVENTDFQATKASGFLRRMAAESPGLWAARKIVVTYVAGWLLPGDANSNMPSPIEAAVFDIIKAVRATRTRTADVKAEEIPDIRRVEYFANVMNMSGGIPPDAEKWLQSYIRPRP